VCVNYQGRHALEVIPLAGHADNGDMLAILTESDFKDGTIELDVAGARRPGYSTVEDEHGFKEFIGVSFRVQDKKYETFFVRPVNARLDNQLFRNRSTQYESLPDSSRKRPCEETPGMYESDVDLEPGLGPNSKLRCQLRGHTFYVNGAAQPRLIVNDLKQGYGRGKIALWARVSTEALFLQPDGRTPAVRSSCQMRKPLRLLLILICWSAASLAQAPEQKTRYGTNDRAGHYVQTPDAKLYYERYGEGGQPVVFLHGGEYGYIDEFAEVIRQVSKQRTVIAIATRGYGRSERGTCPLSHRQFAEDAALVIKDIFKTGEKVDVMGFSEGAITSYILSSSHPELVRRLVAIGGPLGAYGASIEDLENDENLTPEHMQQQVPDLVTRRKKQMIHPEQWDQLIRDLDAMYHKFTYVKQEEIRAIKAPTLIMAGDKDETRLDHFAQIYKLLPNAQLAIIPGCGHMIFQCKPDLSIKIMSDFLQELAEK
jgi:pimeloyl-ACP methyl ester carboxylesterase